MKKILILTIGLGAGYLFADFMKWRRRRSGQINVEWLFAARERQRRRWLERDSISQWPN